ncbi:molybdopterin cofactor-binding domain-containing protein, partial [Escherichia coli]|uniref:molybdopterin cofactor-binding domain-containing protein n=2 Tax=Pseudomonadota TaxID=1224 RepID=UPI00191B4320
SWNARHPTLKRGLAVTPVKFGISFTATLFNQAGALVHVYTDGSVQVNHGGTEMGQGLHTKVAQIVADELGVPLDRVLVTASDTSKVPNASATAASSGTDLNGRAAQFAARHVRDNLAAFVAGLDHCGAGAVQFEN